MSTNSSLVGCLVDRLTTRLPHRSGILLDLGDDEIINLTRSTLLRISTTSITIVLKTLLSLLEDLGRNYKQANTHPPHILLSELYILSVLADCCDAHWDNVRRRTAGIHQDAQESDHHDASWMSDPRVTRAVPQALDDDIVVSMFAILMVMIEPIQDGFVLPNRTILGDASFGLNESAEPTDSGISRDPSLTLGAAELLDIYSDQVENNVRSITQFITASSWTAAFDYFRNKTYAVRTTPQAQGTLAFTPQSEDERVALVMLRLACNFWVDAQKLGSLIQEFCSGFLHFRRGLQNTIAIVTPMLITRWIDRNPEEFIQLYNSRTRLDASADTMFDMTQTAIDNGRRRAVLYPLQITLLFLIPEVFEVASNLRDAKSASLQKKVAFLGVLRKALRNRNESAAYCLVSLLRAARHFRAEGESAMLSYAMDMQEDVRDTMFRKYPASVEATMFDQDLMTAAFVSLTHLSYETSVKNLTAICLASNAPQTFKFALVRGCSYFARLPEADKYQGIYTAVSSFIQSQLKMVTTLSQDFPATGAEAQRAVEKKTPPDCIVCSILDFLDAHPMTLYEGPPEDPTQSELFYQTNFESFMSCMITANDHIRRRAVKVAKKFLSNEELLVKLREAKVLNLKVIKQNFWSLSSTVLATMCDNIGNQAQDAGLKSIHSYLETRLLLLNSIPELCQLSDEIPERIATSTKLETLFLVSLCAAEMETFQLVTSCIFLFLEECRQLDTASESAKSSSSLLRNGEVWREIASRSFRFTGVVAFQTRVRTLLRKMQYPTMGILDAWEEAFDRWIHLSGEMSSLPMEQVEEKILTEWRNYSGFLASLGGVCTADRSSFLDEPGVSGLRWIDKIFSDTCEEPLLGRYLKVSIQLLACGNVKVREALRQILAVEVAPTLFQPLFKAIEAELDMLFSDSLEMSGRDQDRETIFAEQAACLLRSLVERLVTPADLGAASSIHLGQLTLNFVKFMDDVPDSSNSLRVKIKICQLCESVTKRKEHLNLRDDVRIRNQLLEHVYNWISRPRSPRVDLGMSGRQDEISRIQKDLDRVCLKSLAGLTYRLPLQPGDGQNDASTNDLKSSMFHSYFNRFLSLLNHEPPGVSRSDFGSPSVQIENASTGELAITILSNLLSANIDVGLKHSLNIGYHENVEIRTAFVRVLHNILVQGAEFSNISDVAVAEKYEELLEILTHGTTLATAVSKACPSQELDELTISLLSIYEARERTFELIEALVKQEIEDTENESELLRRTCMATKILSMYAKWKGQDYLKQVLRKVIERLMITANDLNLEMDPERVGSKDELKKNALQLCVVSRVFIDDICESSKYMPTSFRKICSIISQAVVVRFKEAKYTAVGAFIFLRFFCPAIVAPDVEGLTSSPPSKEMRRGLLLIAKIIQNLANNVLFGAKEAYMFPLNDFLAENINRVTAFLREISVPPKSRDPLEVPAESFDFGSCVALHRFLYDHRDQVRQRLLSLERRDLVRSPGEAPRARSPILEPLSALIANLGPPTIAITWNRPQVSANTPTSYSRFQNFMLKHASRSAESFGTARAVYDGGESKDGLSIICMILRNIDSESIEYETLIYCYLKIASRMWHKPFGLLIDATCYSGQNEPQDELLKKLELLAPTEVSRQLSRIYVYNMNSAFRKCFRRMIKISIKNENSMFHPQNVDYHLIGSLQDLQSHFHLSQLHLPKETISVVTDTRYVFQPITRLSKTKGKLDVVFKVGSQFVQITTAKKQDVYQNYRLSTTVNDIFRLGDVDEAPTSIQSEDDSAFGLRADNGKIVMYFTSPKKLDVLQTMRGAKQKCKDPRSLKPYERLIRPQDVPGTLLNLALTNLASPDPVLRFSSYNLLGSLCRTFKFSAASKLMCTKDVSVPLDPSFFIIGISRQLAETEPQLTSDFLNEFFVGWESFSDYQKPLSLAYMAPWLPGLRTSMLASEPDGEKGREKIAIIFRKLITVAINDPSLSLTLEQTVWPAVHQDEVLVEILLEEVVKIAQPLTSQDERLENLTSVVAAIGTVTLRGKILSRLRKALNRSSLRPTKHLPDNTVWPEICVLLHFAVSLAFGNGVQAQLYLPEVFHVVTMLANTGPSDIRLLIHRLLINSIHAACTSFSLDEARLSKLRGILESLSESRSDTFWVPVVFARDGASTSTNQESGPSLGATENLARLMFEVCSVAATSVDMANVWRARWMSLVASTAFQNNPAIQPRAFAVMGCLAREEVDDDLLYQVLVALRHSVGRFNEDSTSEMLVAIVASLSKMMAKLPSASRYGLQLFWLAMALLRLVPTGLFNSAAAFLESVLINIGKSTDMKGDNIMTHLLQGRNQLEEVALQLDDAYGIHFNSQNFHHAVCATLVRGLTDTVTKATALHVLSTFLEMTTSGNSSASKDKKNSAPSEMTASAYMALILSRAVTHEELKDSLWLAGINPGSFSMQQNLWSIRDVHAMGDKDLLLSEAIELVDFHYLEDAVQGRILQWLNELAISRQPVMSLLCPTIIDMLEDLLLHCPNNATLESAHELLQTLSFNPRYRVAPESGAAKLHGTLESLGFDGLWRSCSFNQSHEPDKECFALTEKLIELIIV